MKLSELEGFNVKDFILAKFTKEQWASDLVEGRLFMNVFNHFIEQEKQTKMKGQGDSYEAAFVTKVNTIKIFHPETNKLIATAKTGDLIERYEYFKKTPMYCMALFGASDFKVLDLNEERVRIQLDIDEDEKVRFKNDFQADTVVFSLSPSVFVERLKNAAEKVDPYFEWGSVKYADYSIMDQKRKENFEKGTTEFLFTKHKDLSYQREFRIILPSIQTDTPYNLNMGDMSDVFTIMNIDQFLNGSYFEMKFK